MEVTLDIPQPLATSLQEHANREGLTLPEYIVRWLDVDRPDFVKPKTGAELVAALKVNGLIGMRMDITDSAAHARALREEAQTRRRD